MAWDPVTISHLVPEIHKTSQRGIGQEQTAAWGPHSWVLKRLFLCLRCPCPNLLPASTSPFWPQGRNSKAAASPEERNDSVNWCHPIFLSQPPQSRGKGGLPPLPQPPAPRTKPTTQACQDAQTWDSPHKTKVKQMSQHESVPRLINLRTEAREHNWADAEEAVGNLGVHFYEKVARLGDH